MDNSKLSDKMLSVFIFIYLLAICSAQNEEVSLDPVVKCMRPSDARLMRPSMGVSEEWFDNQWHTGPYVSIGNDEGSGMKHITFTSEQNAEYIWLMEDTLRAQGSYFIMNGNMTKLICSHPTIGMRLSWLDATKDYNNYHDDYGCRWMIDIDVNNPANFRIKNTLLISSFPAIGFVYFDKTGIYFDYEQRLRNYPDHSIDESQMWWTFVKSDPEQRDFNDIENDCEIGESGLPTFLENQETLGVDARGVVGGKSKRGKVLKSKDKFVQCAQNFFLFKGKCYRVFKDFRLTYAQGKKVCDFFQGSMFIPRNKKERGFIMKLIRIYDNKPGYYWLGIKADDSGTFRDSANNPVTFKRWARARGAFADDSCGIWKKRWYRANCASTHKVICEKEAAPRLTGSCGKIQISDLDDTMKLEAGKEKDQQDRIVNGQTAFFGQFPWQAGIRFHTPVMAQGVEVTHNCGGSLIDECWVVSAGHCFHGLEKELFYVRIGDMNNAIEDGSEQDFEIDELIVHENYESFPAPTRDIALIKLRKKNGRCAVFNENVQPICLPDDNYVVQPEERCQVSGWGQTNTKLGQSSASANLMWATLPLLTDKYCASRYNQRSELFNKDFMICAGLKKGGVDACTGDSGGPYACRNDAGRYSLTGIVSFGIGCARKKYPGVYTDVREFVPWIATKIQEHGGGNVI